MTIYVGNLSYEVVEDDLRQVFGEYGSIKKVAVPTDRETGKMRGFAFVDLDSEVAEQNAISELDGAEWFGRTLKVNAARPKGQ
ncbi:RNA recognition motif domain-containing protein [Crocosphaera sp. Alani8]|uniref:RNA recognition motif domain-containing protein n=1 Tax=Crocosphaera sp. Alani8 TaxID=3038952 RepID=UPI00313E0CAC